jgi:hypothetical protein
MTKHADLTGGNGEDAMPGVVPPTIDERDSLLSHLAPVPMAAADGWPTQERE